MPARPPFVIFSLPRSRSAWLGQFLSYGDWHCGHDQLRYMRSLDDVKAWLSIPNTGTCETAGAPFWRLLRKYRPDARVVTIRRSVEEVLESVCKVAKLDEIGNARKVLAGIDRKLDQIEGRMSDVRSISFDSLRDEQVCAGLFESCLPYSHNSARWKAMSNTNIQINFPAMVRYVQVVLPTLNKLAAQAKLSMLQDMAVRPTGASGPIIIRAESWDTFLRDCRPLLERHCAKIGEHPDNWMNKNLALMSKLYDLGIMQIMIGRCNGRAFGYLMTLVAPSLEATNLLEAQHAAFFAAEEMPGLGLKLQRAALAALRERGVRNTYMRAGVRGDGGRMDVLYRRLGGEDFGRMYRVELEA